MHSFGYRANALLTFAVTIVALMCDIASFSENLNTPSLTAEIQQGLSVSTAVFDGVKHLIAFGGYNGKYNNEDTHLLLTGGLEKIFHILDLNRPDAPPREVDRSPGSVRTDMGGVRLWDVGSGKMVQTLEPNSSVTSAEVSQDGRYITTADGSILKLWDANQREKSFGIVSRRSQRKILGSEKRSMKLTVLMVNCPRSALDDTITFCLLRTPICPRSTGNREIKNLQIGAIDFHELLDIPQVRMVSF
ncbi:hypothetical protein Pint_11776 [Pistacia integerrima]|uniref:Uncharacterized protein n=1 Tax=Pistacia integerrima TaxID=434235 RepID=A0ACC0XKP2_9ROSI|nr:hypothetical protein Pint_11776 [Pistacia integerrima]